jgi:hypothetical protein
MHRWSPCIGRQVEDSRVWNEERKGKVVPVLDKLNTIPWIRMEERNADFSIYKKFDEHAQNACSEHTTVKSARWYRKIPGLLLL